MLLPICVVGSLKKTGETRLARDDHFSLETYFVLDTGVNKNEILCLKLNPSLALNRDSGFHKTE